MNVLIPQSEELRELCIKILLLLSRNGMRNRLFFIETNKTTILSSPEQYDLMSLFKVKTPTNDYLCVLYTLFSNLSANVSIKRDTFEDAYNPIKYVCMYELKSIDAVQVHRNSNKENSIFE